MIPKYKICCHHKCQIDGNHQHYVDTYCQGILQVECHQCPLRTTIRYSTDTIGDGTGEFILDHSSDSVLCGGKIFDPEEVAGNGTSIEKETGVEDEGEQDDGEDD